MPEITASDLRRLRALEGRLAREEDRRKSLADERRRLREAAKRAERAQREAERGAAALGDRIEQVLTENRELARRLEENGNDVERLRRGGEELRRNLADAQKQLGQATRELERATASVRRVEEERDRLTERLKIADQQLAGKKLTPVMPTKDVSALLDGLFTELAGGLSGLDVAEGEVRLNLAFGKVGGTSGFVVPTPESPPEVRQNLHQVTVRFERLADLPGPEG